MSVAYHKAEPRCTGFVHASRDETSQASPTVRQGGFNLRGVDRSPDGDIDRKTFLYELRIFLQKGLWHHTLGPGDTSLAPPFVWRRNPLRPDASEAKQLKQYWARTNELCQQAGIAHPLNDQLKTYPLQEYIGMCGFRPAQVDDQWMTPELAADLGFEVWELWPSLRNAAPQGIDEAIASAESFAVAIDCLPVGKDIRNRLQSHVHAHIELLRRIAGDPA